MRLFKGGRQHFYTLKCVQEEKQAASSDVTQRLCCIVGNGGASFRKERKCFDLLFLDLSLTVFLECWTSGLPFQTLGPTLPTMPLCRLVTSLEEMYIMLLLLYDATFIVNTVTLHVSLNLKEYRFI